MAEIFRIYVKDLGAIMTHQELRGMWEAACIEAGGKPEPGGVTVHRVPGRSGRVVVAGRAERIPVEVKQPVTSLPCGCLVQRGSTPDCEHVLG